MAPPPSQRARGGVRPLPLDALYEVLLRVPAKDLCRLRAVCRPWRSLLSDSHFVAAHAARHPEPLLIAPASRTGRSAPGHLLDIMDLSGRVIKRVLKPESLCGDQVMTAQLDVFVVLLGTRSCLLLNIATGAVSAFPQGYAQDHWPLALDISDYRQLVAGGQVSSTGEYKLLGVRCRFAPQQDDQLWEVFTLDGSSNARWRQKKAPTVAVLTYRLCKVTISGIVYILSYDLVDMDQEGSHRRIASFDLETEEWRPILRGPLNLVCIPGLNCSLGSLYGCLVMIHHVEYSADLWVLMDFGKDLWAKQHSIPVKLGLFNGKISVRPLLVVNDGRILFYEETGLLRIYDPKTCTCSDVAEIGPCYEIGLYTGSLLSLPDGAGAQLRGDVVEI